MKLRNSYKASLTILILFIFQTLSIMLFSSLVNNVIVPKEFERIFNHMKTVTELCPSQLDSYNYATTIIEYASLNNVQIQIIDQNNNYLYNTGNLSNSIDTLTQVKAGTIDGRPVIIKLDFKISNRWMPNWIKTLAVIVQVTVVVIMYFIVAAVVHSQFVSPIVQLSRRMGIKNISNTPLSHFAGCNIELTYLVERYDELMNEITNERVKQNRIIASISHDIKSPLTSVMGYVERLQAGKADTHEKAQHYLNIIYRKAENIKNLVNEFDDYLSATTSVMQLKKQNVKLLAFLSSLYEDYKTEFDSIGADISFTECAINADTVIYADINRLHRVFGNIFGNAVKYSNNKLAVELKCKVKNNYAVITVSDNGFGVDETELCNIFDPLYMSDKARKSDREGSGLGLSICKSVIEAHDGEITARNITPHGFQIEIAIPVVTEA